MKRRIFLCLLFVFIFPSFSYSREETVVEVDEKELLRQKKCNDTVKLIEEGKYLVLMPNEEIVARKFYYEKIMSLFEKYLNKENKEASGFYYVDVLNNKRPLLLAKIKETEFCNYSYFVYFKENDEIKKLVRNRNRIYNEDFENNYKMFCKGESEMQIARIKGENLLVNKNKNGRLNRIDKLEMLNEEIIINPVCIF